VNRLGIVTRNAYALLSSENLSSFSQRYGQALAPAFQKRVMAEININRPHQRYGVLYASLKPHQRNNESS